MFKLFLQTNTVQLADTLNQLAQGTNSADKTFSLGKIILDAWPIMLPILCLSFYAIYLFISKLFSYNAALKNTDSLINSVTNSIEKGNLDAAQNACKANSGIVPVMLNAGINKLGRPVDEVEKAMENAGKLELAKLEKGTSLLGMIASIAPIFGFIGTIVGVIMIFYKISLQDNISIGAIAEGLYTKMVTSASGLIVGLIAYVAQHILNLQSEALSIKMETTLNNFISFITNSNKK